MKFQFQYHTMQCQTSFVKKKKEMFDCFLKILKKTRTLLYFEHPSTCLACNSEESRWRNGSTRPISSRQCDVIGTKVNHHHTSWLAEYPE